MSTEIRKLHSKGCAGRSARVSDVHRIDIQDFIDRLLATGLAPSTNNVTLHPLRAITRRARSPRCAIGCSTTWRVRADRARS
jgi:hypothetical protein